MDAATRDLVRRRAGNRCEYCLLHQDFYSVRHHIEHVWARQHGGTDDPENLALACQACNLRKGPNLTGVDPLTGDIVPLFNPRADVWEEHFRSLDAVFEGTTRSGRAMVQLLAMNGARRVELRRLLNG